MNNFPSNPVARVFKAPTVWDGIVPDEVAGATDTAASSAAAAASSAEPAATGPAAEMVEIPDVVRNKRFKDDRGLPENDSWPLIQLTQSVVFLRRCWATIAPMRII